MICATTKSSKCYNVFSIKGDGYAIHFLFLAVCGLSIWTSPVSAFSRGRPSTNSVFHSSLIKVPLQSTAQSNVWQESISMDLVPSEEDSTTRADDVVVVDDRPYAHRAPQPRPARRLNHGFKYLYRHDVPKDLPTDAMQYLMEYGGYSMEQVLAMNATFPPLLTLSVAHQLHPKMRFLKETLGIVHPHLEPTVPAEYFGARLEKILAPRHAWLVHNNLTHGAALFRTPSTSRPTTTMTSTTTTTATTTTTLWTDFVRAARKPKGMAALCTEWTKQQQQQESEGNPKCPSPTTPRQIEAFDTLFGRGLLAMARNELVQHNNTWPLDYFSIHDNLDCPEKPHLTAADLTRLLIQHGANPHALDHRGVSLLHWAAGAGNLPVLKVLCRAIGLIEGDQDGGDEKKTTDLHIGTLVTERDHATLLHWAAAGAKAREFGCGGHVLICEFLLSQWDAPTFVANITRREYVNAATLDGNSALHWAAWSGTLETVKLLVRYRANVHHANRNGCTVAHWAASGGNLDVCKYLHSICGVDFSEPNAGGNTPLTHAVAFGRANVVEWLRNEVLVDDLQSDQAALNLAQDFASWLPTDERRKQVLQLFQEFIDYDQGTPATLSVGATRGEEDFVY